MRTGTWYRRVVQSPVGALDVPMLFVGFVLLSKRFSCCVCVQVSVARPFALISNPGFIHTSQFVGGLFGSRWVRQLGVFTEKMSKTFRPRHCYTQLTFPHRKKPIPPKWNAMIILKNVGEEENGGTLIGEFLVDKWFRIFSLVVKIITNFIVTAVLVLSFKQMAACLFAHMFNCCIISDI